MWSVAALLVVGLLGIALGRRMHRRGQPAAACVAAAALCTINPFTFEAVRLDQHQQLVAGALCAGIALYALRTAAPSRRVRLWSIAACVALIVALMPNPVVLAPGIPLAALWWGSRGRTPDDALGLLALVLLLGCALGQGSGAADHAPFLFALVAWEGLTRRGLPVASLLSAAAIWVTAGGDWYLPVALPIGLWLAARLYLPAGKLPRLRAWPAPVRQASTAR